MTKLICKCGYEKIFEGVLPKKGTKDYKCPVCKKIMSEYKCQN